MKDVSVSTESKQDYATPIEFVQLVEKQFGVNFVLDLAATTENSKAPACLKSGSLEANWKVEFMVETVDYSNGCCWLNPPFKNVAPWMEKCKLESGKDMKIITLTLASLGAKWYKDHVYGNALSFVLQNRIVFEGCKDPFPKDLMLSLWGFGMIGQAFWNWKK